MNIKIITFSKEQSKLLINNELMTVEDVVTADNSNSCFLFFHSGDHEFDYWWTKPNSLETDILYARHIENTYKIHINFVDMSGMMSSMIEFSKRYKSLNLNSTIKNEFEAIYQKILSSISEKGKETN
jgi:hypothetical protein